MKITTKPAANRGTSNLGWLKSQHSFSFGDYYDAKNRGFETLRVINDDRVAPGAGFGEHPHQNMEIISYVLSGTLAHKDSLGHKEAIQAGDVQRISAGSGITHSEYNHSADEEVHFLQIWFLPKTQNIKPSYEQKHFSAETKRGCLTLIASELGRDGSMTLNQDVDMLAGLIHGHEAVKYPLTQGRKAWVQIARGSVSMNDIALQAGDGATIENITNPEELIFTQGDDAEVLIFDMKPA